jgi:protein involved in polysaccharide export with SLBB domain
MRYSAYTIPVLILLWFFPFAGNCSAQVTDDQSRFVLRAGDVIRITVWQKPQLSGEFSIREDGSIADPFYMEVNVAGVSIATVNDRIQAYVERFETSPRILVQPLVRVSITGAVHDPGLYTVELETTVAQAVMLAGGPTERGRRDIVRLVRGLETYVIEMDRPTIDLAYTPVQSGDHLIVEYRPRIFREYIVPVASIAGAAASVLNVILRYR